jgi:2-succinyl-5-enolpyruvyl-6-hydroxy-3-cyclohexene-1-carboxylate synthase
MSSTAEVLAIGVGAFVDELARAGVTDACVCPGSRSTPLALLLAAEARIKLWMHLDERSASYFALGLARATRRPVVLLATSGTAAANFLPAVVEASLARVPLVVLTADRPHELRDVGAAQTIDQIRLYGSHARWFFDLPEPETTPEHERLVRIVAARAVGTAAAEPAGPVHVNWPFREPLVPASRSGQLHTSASVAVESGRLTPRDDLVHALGHDLAKTPRGIVVCGPQDDPDLPESVSRFAAQFGFPVLADALSNVRTGSHDRRLVIDAYDAFLRDPLTVERLAPECIVRIGAIPTSKPLIQYMERYPNARQIVVDPAPGAWRDPTGVATDVLHVDPRALCDALAREPVSEPAADWIALWQATNRRATEAIADSFAAATDLSEGQVFAELQRLLPPGATLFAGNSMPVRDLDSFLSSSDVPLRCLSNRGANGIDGVVSSALGASAAAAEGPVVLAIGDVSFYHDLNGLLAARRHGLDLLVVLLDNDGGGIFSFLPQAETASSHFETLFGTPHGLDFQPFVEAYGGRFVSVADWPSFVEAVTDSIARGGLQVVRVPSERERNVAQHRAVWRAVADALSPAPVLA